MSLIDQLDLEGFLARFAGFLARPKGIKIEHKHTHIWQHLQELETLPFSPPPSVQSLENALKVFKKGGAFRLETLFEIVKITRYFLYLTKITKLKDHPHLHAYLNGIGFPDLLLELESQFGDTPVFKSGFYPDLDALLESLGRLKVQQQKIFSLILARPALGPYLVDRQVHFVNGTETLLLKPGFSVAIKASIIQRSHTGQFYIQPLEAQDLSHKILEIQNKIVLCVDQICTRLSQDLRPYFLFLRFINREFDYLDHLLARVSFAKAYQLHFIQTSQEGALVLKDFAHPNLNNPKPISLIFDQNLLMVTGVNTGGKTMLLKSILSAAFLAKHLLPFKINANHSQIPYVENIVAIINDPQNSKNDISTFAGRMLDFSAILNTSDLLLGVDEIELGTDATEASCLYKVLLEFLINKGAKIVITTHHKHLALLLAKNKAVQLLAAHFDTIKQLPTYTFSPGVIGRSYAFESALRYGIPVDLVEQARAIYGADQENLNALIERTSAREQELLEQQALLEQKIQAQQEQELESLEKLKSLEQTQQARIAALEKSYQRALRDIQEALRDFERSSNKSKAHQNIHQIQQNLTRNLDQAPKLVQQVPKLELGSPVFYKKSSTKQRGQIIGQSGALFLIALDNGLKIKAGALDLELAPPSKNKSPHVKLENKPIASASMTLDVHGLDVEETLEEAQRFLANALLAGFNEVVIIHGKGKGILRQALRAWLKNHPKVLDFHDAPLKLGGSGAQVVKI